MDEPLTRQHYFFPLSHQEPQQNVLFHLFGRNPQVQTGSNLSMQAHDIGRICMIVYIFSDYVGHVYTYTRPDYGGQTGL